MKIKSGWPALGKNTRHSGNFSRWLSAPDSGLKQLSLYFGSVKLSEITQGKVEQFKVWLSKIPTRSKIEEVEGGLVLTPNPKGKQRSLEAINRPVELLRVMLNYAVDERMISPEPQSLLAKIRPVPH